MDKKIIIVLAIALIIQIPAFLGFYRYGWDESTYMHAAEYFRTFGKQGFLEDARPILFPIFLIFFPDFFSARILILALSLASLYVFYLISKNEKHAWIFPLLLMTFPLYYQLSGQVLTEIPAILFHLLSIYFFLKKRYAISGSMAVVSTFMRFPFGIYFFILAGFLVCRDRKRIPEYLSGSLIAVPLFFIHGIIFRPFPWSMLQPVVLQLKNSMMTSYVWFYNQPVYYYLLEILKWPAAALAVFSFKKKNLLYWSLFLIPLLYMTLAPIKYDRYVMLAAPWIVYLAGLGTIEIMKKMDNLASVFIILILGISLFSCFSRDEPKMPLEFYGFASRLENSTGTVLTAFPYLKTKGKITIGYNDETFFLAKLNPFYEHVYYSRHFFPCNNDECRSRLDDIEGILDENYDVESTYLLLDEKFILYKKKT